MNKFTWLKTYFSPFLPIKPKFYIGEIAVGTPYFFPRKWVNNKEKPGYMKCVPKKIGFDFVGLGWKTKWSADDFRHEYNPIWSFVFFKWQIAIIFSPENDMNYWECWLTYELTTDKSKSVKERLKEAKDNFPCKWIEYNGDDKSTVCYWDLILKKKYL